MTQKNSTHHFTVEAEDNKTRLDKFLADRLDDITRSRIQDVIRAGHVLVNGKAEDSCNSKVQAGDEVSITLPEVLPTTMQAADIPLHIVYEDGDLLVLDKQAGLTVHPGAGNHQDTLANALIAHCGESLSGIGGVERPGIVHRLDKDTSGLMVVAKHDKAHVGLSEQIAKRTLVRKYLALVWRVPSPIAGVIKTNIGRDSRDRKKMAVQKTAGKEAVTHYKVIECYMNDKCALVECKLDTGRTHQIRVHMHHLKHPIIGDPVYKQNPIPGWVDKAEESLKSALLSLKRQALHSYFIGFSHPISGEWLEFERNLHGPTNEDMSKVIEALIMPQT